MLSEDGGRDIGLTSINKLPYNLKKISLDKLKIKIKKFPQKIKKMKIKIDEIYNKTIFPKEFDKLIILVRKSSNITDNLVFDNILQNKIKMLIIAYTFPNHTNIKTIDSKLNFDNVSMVIKNNANKKFKTGDQNKCNKKEKFLDMSLCNLIDL